MAALTSASEVTSQRTKPTLAPAPRPPPARSFLHIEDDRLAAVCADMAHDRVAET